MAGNAYDALIFDLDGTLWDAAEASTYGWNLALAELGVATRVTVHGIRSVSGYPFPRCVEILLPDLYPASKALIEALDRAERTGIETLGGSLYPGVAGGLPRLAAAYGLFVVSNCPAWYLSEFIRLSGLGGHLSGYDCHGLSGTGKAEMLAGLHAGYGLTRAVYVGDTQGDREAAESAGMDFVFARYGFGSVDDAALSFGSFSELVEHFLDGRSSLAGGGRTTAQR
ncbi:MAG: HAD family hydrolase [Actinomycetia bacterium]|nr:HAD family hydrolase [Actinomycetes bacterium]